MCGRACPLYSLGSFAWMGLLNTTTTQIRGSGGIEKSHSCKWAKWIQWHALPHIQQSTQQRNKGYYPNLHGWDFSIPPLPNSVYSPAKWWRHTVAIDSRYCCYAHQYPIGFVLWSVRSWFKTGKAWTGVIMGAYSTQWRYIASYCTCHQL